MARSLWRARLARVLAMTGAVALSIIAIAHGTSTIGGLPDAYLRSAAGAAFFSLGGAATADPPYLAAWWNPAALASIKGPRVALGGGMRTLGRADGFGSFEYRAMPRLGLGAALLYRGDPFLRDLKDNEGDDLGSGSYTTLTWKLGLGYYLSRRMSVGAAFTVFYQTLPALSSTGTAWVFTVGGLDAALRYRVLDSLTLTGAIRDVNASMDWQFESGGLDQTSSGNLPVAITVGSRYGAQLAGRPLAWFCDIRLYAFDSKFDALPRTVAVINNGLEWRRWDTFAIRAGIAEISLNSDLFRNPQRFGEEFSMGLTAGFGARLDSVVKGLSINYAMAINKVWAGVDQQMDVTYEF